MAEPRCETFYREVPVGDAGIATRRLLTTTLRHRCPACGGARVTAGVVGVVDRCPVCESRFDRFEGNELIAIPLSFFLTVVALLAIALAVIPRYGFFDGLMFVLAGAGIVLVLALVRPVRMLTLWLLWVLGFVYPDRLPDKGRYRLPRSSSERSSSERSSSERSCSISTGRRA